MLSFFLYLSLKRNIIENSSSIDSESIANGLYVDNLIHSTQDENKLIDVYEDSNTLLRQAGFHLRDWNSKKYNSNSKKYNSNSKKYNSNSKKYNSNSKK